MTLISPTSGTTGGGTALTITGTGFLAGATVSLGGTAATNVVVVSSTSINATTPAHATGAVNVVVTNSDGHSGTLMNGYTYTGVSGGSISFVQAECGAEHDPVLEHHRGGGLSGGGEGRASERGGSGMGRHHLDHHFGYGHPRELYTLAVGPTSNTGLRQ